MGAEDIAALQAYRGALQRLPADAHVAVAELSEAASALAELNPDGDGRVTRAEALRYVDALLARAPSLDAPPYDGMRAAFVTADRMVTKAAGSRPPLPAPVSPSRRSLMELVDKLWDQRARPISADDVYRLYSAPREPNPRSITPTDYFDQLGRIAAARSPDAVSNIQGLKLRGPATNDAMSPVFAAAKRGELPPAAIEALGRTFYRFERAGWEPENIRERVYIHAAADHAPSVASFVVREILDKPNAFPGVEMAKVSGPDAAGARSENIVIYTNGDAAAERVVDALRRYQRQNPGHMMPTTNMMTEQRLPGVSLGAEPSATLGGNFSFGSLRAAVIASAFQTQREQQPTMSRGEFNTQLDGLLRQAGVDPERPHRNVEPRR